MFFSTLRQKLGRILNVIIVTSILVSTKELSLLEP